MIYKKGFIDLTMLGVIALLTASFFAGQYFDKKLRVNNELGAVTVVRAKQGGTGTSSTPVKGDLLVGSTTDWAILGVGSNDNCFIADSTKPYGVKWATCPSTGAVFAWTVTSDGNSTSTRLIFGNGFISQASSTATNRLSVTGIFVASSTSYFDGVANFGGNLVPQVTDGSSLGTSAFNFSDLFLDSGAVINFDSGDITLTHGTDSLTFGGGIFTIPYASTTALTISTASTTNLLVSALTSTRVPYISTAGLLQDSGNLTFNNTDSRLTLLYASTTAVSGTNLNFGTLTLTTSLGIASGGTNASSFTTSGNAIYYTGSALATAPAGSAITIPYASTTALTVSTTASTTDQLISSIALGSVVFGGADGLLSDDNSNLFFDDSNNRLGVATVTPGSTLSVGDTTGINFKTGTSTFSSTGGIDVNAGCFAVRGVCVGGGGGTDTNGWRRIYATSTNFATSTINIPITTKHKNLRLHIKYNGFNLNSVLGMQINGDATSAYISGVSENYAAPTDSTLITTWNIELSAHTNPGYHVVDINNEDTPLKHMSGHGHIAANGGTSAMPTTSNVEGIWKATASTTIYNINLINSNGRLFGSSTVIELFGSQDQ